MELLCVEVIMKRKELLGIANDSNPSDANIDKNVCETLYYFLMFGSNFTVLKILFFKLAKVEDAILSCKVVEVVYKNGLKQMQGIDLKRSIYFLIKLSFNSY